MKSAATPAIGLAPACYTAPGFYALRDEDVATCLAVQRGLASAFAAPGRLSAMEAPLGRFPRAVERLTRDGQPAGMAGTP